MLSDSLDLPTVYPTTVNTMNFEQQPAFLTMNTLSSPSLNDFEDGAVLDSSTAPTTPEGSFLSSPVLQPQILDSPDFGIVQAGIVRNICCVGAGYVGKIVFLF